MLIPRDSDVGRRTFKKHDMILKEGAVGDAAYLIVKGKVQVRKNHHGRNPRVLAELGKGNIFGEMALFDDRPHIATVIALEDTEVSVMSRDEFRRLVEDMSPVMKGVLGMMVARLRQTVDELVPDASKVSWADWKK